MVAKRKLRGSTADEARGLQWLLGKDMSLEEFQTKHFEKEPLHIKRGATKSSYYERFSDLATPEALFALMDSGQVPVYRVNMFRCRDGSKKETPQPPPSSPADVRRLFAEGWSIQWLQPQQEHLELAKLVAGLESEFGSLVGVNAYLTPPNTQGLAPHWDDVEVFVLQLSGEKAWSLHRSLTTSPLSPEAQTLPRFSSGDLPKEALSPLAAEPLLTQGDLLYFPRGVIHHAPNRDSGRPSVHLTISTLQRQSFYDLASKTFEEAMAEMWDADEGLRRSLPWSSLGAASKAYPSVCASVAGALRRLADKIDGEAKAAASTSAASQSGPGAVASALSELGGDFVKHRMPPLVAEMHGDEECHLVSVNSRVTVPDPSTFALLPHAGTDDGSERLVTCLRNSRRQHMMQHPEDAGSECDAEEGGESEAPEHDDAEEGSGEGGEEEEDDDMEDGEEDGMVVSQFAAAVLRELCRRSPAVPLAYAREASRQPAGVTALDDVFDKIGTPSSERIKVCGLLTQLVAEGLLHVVTAEAGGVASAKGQAQKPKKKRKTA